MLHFDFAKMQWSLPMDDNPLTISDTDRVPVTKRRSRLENAGCLLFAGGFVLLLLFLVFPYPRIAPRGASRRMACLNNLRQIGLALLSYEAAYHALPPAHTVGSDGQPLHSWRTLILPYLEEGDIFAKIDLTRPWNDPVNAAARDLMPDAYRCPASNRTDGGTPYLAIVGLSSCFPPHESRRLSEIKDGGKNTVMVLEAPEDNIVHWMSPQDADEELLPGIGPDTKTLHTSVVQLGFADGSVRSVPKDTQEQSLRAMVTVAGNEVLQSEP